MKIKKFFPIFNNNSLVYLDNAATTQKPEIVIDAVYDFYSKDNANVKRGIYDLSERATQAYEDSRKKVADFINADAQEVAFTKGTTDSINIIAQTWGESNISAGDEIIVTELEHHSNFVPWQQLAKRKGAVLKVVPITSVGTFSIDLFKDFITLKTKLVAISHLSNVLNIQMDDKRVARLAHSVGAKVIVDAAQSVAHTKINVKDLKCDFLAFSAHKMFGPTGIGALFVKKDLLADLRPVQFGGGMVFEVGLNETQILKTIHKLESGTPAIAEAIGFGAAVDFIKYNIDFEQLKTYKAELCKSLMDGLDQIKGINILGAKNYSDKTGYLVCFTVNGIHPHDVAAYLNQHNICVRAGHHCAQPLHKKLGVDSSVRISFSIYNDIGDVEAILSALNKLKI